MKRIIPYLPILLLFPMTVFACPGCTYERLIFAAWWEKTFVLRVIAATLLSLNRLDVVRVVYTFLLYQVVWYYAHRYAILYSHPAAAEGLVHYVGIGSLLLLLSGLPGALLLFLLGKTTFYRRNPDEGIPIWQALLFIPVAITIQCLV